VLTFPLSEYAALLPIAAVVVAGLVALLADLGSSRESKVGLSYISLLGVVLAGLAAAAFWSGPRDQVVLGGAIAVSRLGFTLSLGVLAGAGIAALYSAHYGEGTPVASGEHFGLLLFATAGCLALVVANDFATLFVALETLSISVYALTGTLRARARSAEGAMKYFVLGAFSSGFLLFGIALVYGAAGTQRLDEIAHNGLGVGGPLAVCGVAFILVGLLFKVGAVPFHAWIPDAYTAAPAGVTGFMSVAVKAAAFGAALRVLAAVGVHRNLTFHIDGSGGMHLGWILWGAAALTMIVGNAGAFTQTNPRRLLAYSGIAHTGYALVGLVALGRYADFQRGIYNPPGVTESALATAAHDGAAGVVYYLVGYGVANLAAFAVLCYLERAGEDVEDLQHLSGLGKTRPFAALAMTIAMISLAGVPPTSGFIAKLWVFRAAIADGNDTGLVVLGVLASALSLGYYLPVVVKMYMRQPGEPESSEAAAPARAAPLGGESRRWGARLALALTAAATLVLGIAPGPLLDLATTSAAALF
jgi:NADH-quinone oxidoreductase subunit N